MKTNTELEFCMDCGKVNPQDQEICKCGSRNFVFGNNFSYTDKKVICNCGNDKFKQTFHMSGNPIYTTNYKCTKCKNLIGVQTYYESPYI